jgi:hypothetical protein
MCSALVQELCYNQMDQVDQHRSVLSKRLMICGLPESPVETVRFMYPSREQNSQESRVYRFAADDAQDHSLVTVVRIEEFVTTDSRDSPYIIFDNRIQLHASFYDRLHAFKKAEGVFAAGAHCFLFCSFVSPGGCFTYSLTGLSGADHV